MTDSVPLCPSDAPSRLDVLASMYETSNHIRELWGEAPLSAITKKTTAASAICLSIDV